VSEFADGHRVIIKGRTKNHNHLHHYDLDAINQCDLVLIAGTLDPEILTEAISQAEKKAIDRKSTRLNSSHGSISYAVVCFKKKKAGLLVLEQVFLRRADGVTGLVAGPRYWFAGRRVSRVLEYHLSCDCLRRDCLDAWLCLA